MPPVPTTWRGTASCRPGGRCPAIRGESRLAIWLHRIAHRCFLMQQRAADPPALSIDDSAIAEVAAAEVDPRPSPALAINLERAPPRLTQHQRWVLIHCHHLELRHEEAAEVLGWPLGTLKSHMARGKAALRLGAGRLAIRGAPRPYGVTP